MPQKEWPSVRPNNTRGNRFNITQLSCEVDVDVDGFSLDYQVSIYFEISDQLWAKDVIMVMIKMRLKAINIELGTRIGNQLLCIVNTSLTIGMESLNSTSKTLRLMERAYCKG